MVIKRATQIAILCVMPFAGAASAEVFFERQNSVDESGRRDAVLMVLGHIEAADADAFAAHLKVIRWENLRLLDDSVWLHSWGVSHCREDSRRDAVGCDGVSSRQR